VHLNPVQLEALTSWIDRYRLIHEEQFRRLDALLQDIEGASGATKQKEKER
jgi:hypothetical protein